MNNWIARLWAGPNTAASTPTETKASRTSKLFAFDGVGQPVWTPRNYEALAQEGFKDNTIGYRCVRLIAESAASVPWLLYEGEREHSEHPLLNLLARPNPVQDGRSLLENFYGHLQVSGNAYLEACFVGDQVRELHVLRPDRMKLMPGSDGWPEAYEYSANGRTIKINRDADAPIDPVLHLKLFNPLDDYYGLSPLEPGAKSIDIHNASGAWAKALLDNAARPSGALLYRGSDDGGNLSDDQLQRLKDDLSTAYQGAANAGRPIVLEGGLDWKPLAHSPKEMEHIEAKHVAAREIALAFGVPPMLLGIPGDNTYANYAEANRGLWRHTVLPLVARSAAALSHWLKPAFGPDLRLGFDTDQVDALALDRTALWERLTKADFLTPNEKRAAIGYAPVSDGNQLAD